MLFTIGMVLVATLVLGSETGSSQPPGTRLLAVALLLSTTFLFGVIDAAQPIALLAVGGLLMLALTLPKSDSPTEAVPRSGRRMSVSSLEPTVLALCLTTWMLARNVAAVGPGFRVVAPYTLAIVALVGIEMLRSAGQLSHASLARPFIAFLAAVLLLSPYLSETPWLACRAEKCSFAGQIYRGIFPSENSLAIFVAFALTLALATTRRSTRLIQVPALLAILLATGARTALFGLGLALVVAGAVSLLSRREASDHLRLAPWAAVSTAAGITAAALALLGTADEFTLSGRGRTWVAALEQVPLTSLTGAGSSRWTELQDRGLLTQHFPHSQFLHLLFSGGLVAVGLWTWILVALLLRAHGDTRPKLMLQLAPIILIGLFGATEIIWNPATIDSFTVLIVSVLLVSPRLRSAHEPGELPIAEVMPSPPLEPAR